MLGTSNPGVACSREQAAIKAEVDAQLPCALTDAAREVILAWHAGGGVLPGHLSHALSQLQGVLAEQEATGVALAAEPTR